MDDSRRRVAGVDGLAAGSRGFDEGDFEVFRRKLDARVRDRRRHDHHARRRLKPTSLLR